MMPSFKRTKFACYAAYFTMSSIFSLPPLLFVTLHDTYGVSYTLLGTLVLTNFCTQLAVDLIFTLFAKHFNVKWVVRIMPLITSAGLFTYALIPMLFPEFAYGGLLIGTVIFSVSAGLSEVLLSPVIAAIPSENPQRDMSLLHSLYAFGVLFVVLVSTVLLKLIGTENWMYLTMFFAALPVIAAVLFMTSPMPDMQSGSDGATLKDTKRRGLGLALCVGCIFFGSCAENVMSNWISTYMENALHLDKALGDILGLALFAVLLGLARVAYGKYGKRIFPVLLWGMILAAACYVTVALSSNAVVALIACAATGLFTAMLWPGALIMMEEKLPGVGVAAFALMAAGGDLGASVAPQLMGIVVDKVAAGSTAAELAVCFGLSPEQIGLKVGMLITAIFPILGALLLLLAMRYFKKQKQESNTLS